MGNPRKEILLIPADGPVLEEISGRIGTDTNIRWIYLGNDTIRFRAARAVLDARAEHRPLGDLIQKRARMHRQEYIDFIGRLGRGRDPVAWYLTTLSEKNPFVSDFYLHFCYVSAARDAAEEDERDMIIVCESRCIRAALEDLFGSEQAVILKQEGWHDQRLAEAISGRIASAGAILRFLAKFGLRILAARISRRQHVPPGDETGDGPHILLHTWVDKRSFPETGGYRDIYFGNLAQILEGEGLRCTRLMNILPTVSFRSAVRKVRQMGEGAFLFEDLLSLRDLLSAVLFVRRSYPRDLPAPLWLAGIRVDALVGSDMARDRRSYRAEQSFLSFLAAEKIAQMPDIGSLMYTFENHIWEKMFILGFRHSRNKIQIAGYAHTTVNPMETCYSVSSEELDRMPLPDRITVNGRQSGKILVESGFPAERVVVGGRLRFPAMDGTPGPERQAEKKTLLVALSADANKSAELLLKASEAFGSMNTADVLIKPHPILPGWVTDQYLPAGNPRFRKVDPETPIESLLPGCHAVFFADSTVAFEAIAYGVPAIQVQSDLFIDLIDMTVVTAISGISPVLRPDQMRSGAEAAIRGDLRITDEQRSRVLSAFFPPVDKKAVAGLVLPFRPASDGRDAPRALQDPAEGIPGGAESGANPGRGRRR